MHTQPERGVTARHQGEPTMMTLTERELIEQLLKCEPEFVANNLLCLLTSSDDLDRAFADYCYRFIRELAAKCQKVIHLIETDPFTP